MHAAGEVAFLDGGQTGPVATELQPAIMLFILTFITGLLDPVTYLDLGQVFAANQTGNVIVIGFALVGTGKISVTASLASLAAFVMGAAFSGWTTPRLQRAIRGWTRVCFR